MINTIRRPLVRWLQVAAALFISAACSKKDTGSATQTAGGSIGATTSMAAGAVRVADVTLGRGIGADKRISDATDTFKPSETIYASIHTTGGNGSSTPLTVRWTFQDGQQVDEHSETIAPTGDAYTEFHISKPGGWPAGTYTVHVLTNGREIATKNFTVAK